MVLQGKTYKGVQAIVENKTIDYFQEIVDIKEKLPSTDWWCKLENAFQSSDSNTILLTGNIHDYMIPGATLFDYLYAQLKSKLNIDEVSKINVCAINNFEIANTCSQDEIINIVKKISHALKFNDRRRAVILEYPEEMVTNYYLENVFNVYLRTLVLDMGFRKSNNILILVCRNYENIKVGLLDTDMPIKIIEILHPNEKERATMINHLYSTNNNMQVKMDLVKLARITTGLNRMNLENLWNYSLRKGVLEEKYVLDHKNKIISQQYESKLNICDCLNKKMNLDNFGGMNDIKNFVRTDIIEAIKKGDKETISKGMLFMGPPGTGKTFFAKCIAQEAGVTFIELRLDSINSRWVGETEENLRKILNCIKSITPVIVFIDEIDQVLTRDNGDSNPTRGYIFHMMLTIMSDEAYRGKIIWIGATNYPGRLDQALIRTGRFDNKFIFMPPSDNKERTEVLKVQLELKQYPYKLNFESEEYIDFIERLENYTQAEIEGVITKAISLCKREGNKSLSIDHLNRARRYIKKISNDQIEEMIQQAVDNCNDLEFVPQYLIDKYNL